MDFLGIIDTRYDFISKNNTQILIYKKIQYTIQWKSIIS